MRNELVDENVSKFLVKQNFVNILNDRDIEDRTKFSMMENY